MDLFKLKDKYGEELRCLNIYDKYVKTLLAHFCANL